MDSYLDRILLRQKADPGEERSQSVLEKLKAEIGASAEKAGQPPSAEARKEDTELQRDEAELKKEEAELRRENTERRMMYESEQKRNAELTQMAVQLMEALRKEQTPGRVSTGTKKTEDSSGVIRYGVIPAEVRQEEGQEQMNLSMDALSRYFERDARRYPG